MEVVDRNLFDSAKIMTCEDEMKYEYMVKMPCFVCKAIINTRIPIHKLVVDGEYTWECSCGQKYIAKDGLISLVKEEQ